MHKFRVGHLPALPLAKLAAAVSGMLLLDTAACAFTVTDCTDSLASTKTLRYGITHAASAEVVDVSACSASAITLAHGEIASSQPKVYVRSTKQPVIVKADTASRVFNHTGTGYLRLDSVWVREGNVTGSSAKGGCIYSNGQVTLTNSSVKYCSVTETSSNGLASGGGIYSKNGVVMTSSRIAGNTATQQSSTQYRASGGGIYSTTLASYNSVITGNLTLNSAGGLLNRYTSGGGAFIRGAATLYGTLVYDNKSGTNGGVALATQTGDNVVISNSTVASNTDYGTGGDIWAGGDLLLANSTVAFNHSNSRPTGVYVQGKLTLQSSIVANNNYGAGNVPQDIYIGTFKGSLDAASANNIVIAANTAMPADTIAADPRLLPLAFNGGQIKTMAFDAESPALDRGNNKAGISSITGPPTCDQRGNPNKPLNSPPNTGSCSIAAGGFLRADGLHNKPDIGAYEEQRPNDWIFYDGLEYPP